MFKYVNSPAASQSIRSIAWPHLYFVVYVCVCIRLPSYKYQVQGMWERNKPLGSC
jgi:hypothetical protein